MFIFRRAASGRTQQLGHSFSLFTTSTNPIIHLFYAPKICNGIVFDFCWDIFMSQEKLQTMVTQTFWGVIEVYYGIVQVVNTDLPAGE